MASYAKHFSTKSTPQSEAIPGSKQVPNSAGGFAFPVDDWVRLDRFLILGSEGGSYYASEKKLTVENAQCVLRCLAEDGPRTVARIVEISEAGRAPKNDPAIFALSMAVGRKPSLPEAFAAIPKVCRIGTHIFMFAEAVQAFRGWGRGLRKAIGEWYTGKEPANLAFQCVKYQQRNGWSHRDLLRLSHPKTAVRQENGILRDLAGIPEILHWVVKGWEGVCEDAHPNPSLQIIWAFERAKRATDKKEICKLIRDHNLPRECVPTQFLTEADVWDALLEKMPMTAMIRNLATMTRVGLLAPMSKAVGKVLKELGDAERLKKSRIHPVAVLAAMLTYAQGHGERGQNTWTPVSQVVDALDGAFYKSFGNVTPTGKRWMLALDVSGSMGCGQIAGVPGLTPRVGSCAMALVTAAVEPQHCFVAFTSGGWSHRGGHPGQWASMGYNNGITPFDVSPRQRLDDVCRKTDALPMGGTDCALPMLYAMEQKIPVDVFVVVTDNETWAGGVHPTQALQQYRQKMGIGAKEVVVGMISNGFTIADPNDAGQMDVVGFDTATPQLISDFAAN